MKGMRHEGSQVTQSVERGRRGGSEGVEGLNHTDRQLY